MSSVKVAFVAVYRPPGDMTKRFGKLAGGPDLFGLMAATSNSGCAVVGLGAWPQRAIAAKRLANRVDVQHPRRIMSKTNLIVIPEQVSARPIIALEAP